MPDSLTGQFLAGTRRIEVPAKRRQAERLRRDRGRLRAQPAEDRRRRSRSGVLCCVTGVSGSGKSTLVNEVLYKAVGNRLHQTRQRAGSAPADHRPRPARQDHLGRPVADRPHAALEPGHLHRAVRPDPRAVLEDPGGAGARLQARPVLVQRQGRALRGVPRRRPDQDRDALPARTCTCPCEQCHGKRYNRETLEVRFKGKTIADVLEMPIEEALEFFAHIPKIRRRVADAERRRARLHAPRPARDDAVGRRGPAGQARGRAVQGGHRADALHPRRAHHRAALRRHPAAARGAAAPGRRRATRWS